MKEFNATGICIPEKYYMEAVQGWLVTFCFLKSKEKYIGLQEYEEAGKKIIQIVI